MLYGTAAPTKIKNTRVVRKKKEKKKREVKNKIIGRA